MIIFSSHRLAYIFLYPLACAFLQHLVGRSLYSADKKKLGWGLVCEKVYGDKHRHNYWHLFLCNFGQTILVFRCED